MRRLAALLLAGCAATQPRPVVEPDPEMGLYLIARIVADGCTSQATDEVLVEHAVLLLRGCHLSTSACIRRACKHLAGEDEAECPRARPVAGGLVWPGFGGLPTLLVPDSMRFTVQ